MEKSYDKHEQRRYRRIKKKFTIRLHINPKDKPDMAGEDEMLSLQDISAGGALISYNREIKIGVLVDLEIRFSPTNSIKCLGRVLRVGPSSQPKASGRPPMYDIAVKFIETLDKTKEEFLYRIIEEHHARDPEGKD